MSKKVINARDGVAGVAYSPNLAIAFTSTQPSNTGVRPTQPIDGLPLKMGPISPWGVDNLFPQKVITDVNKNPTLSRGIYNMANAVISGGIVYGYTEQNPETGEEKLIPKQDPVVDAFFRQSNIKRYFRESSHEFFKFWNVFPEMILSKDRSKITNITCQESSFCRMGLQNEKTGIIDNVYLNARWESFGPEDSRTIKIPLLDPYFFPVESLRARKDSYKYIYPVSGVSSGQLFYQDAPWNAIRVSGWLDFANSIPVFKKALMTNQINLKYHIEVDAEWWLWKYPDWDAKTQDERDKLQADKFQEINDFLTGEKNAGRSIMTVFKFDLSTGKEYAGWKINPIGEKYQTGIYVEDSQEAVSHILMALGIDGSLVGILPGKGLGSGTGSEKRVAYNIWIQNSKPEQDILLEPLEFIRDYNGWDPKLNFWFRNYWMQTLDQGKTSQQQAS